MAGDDDFPPGEPPEDEPPGGGRWRDDEPPEDDLPATGAHNIFEDDEPEEERIPSFEEYRRSREERSHPVEEGEETLPARGGSGDDEDGETLDGGDTLDGGEELEGLGLPDPPGESLYPIGGPEEPPAYEAELAREAADIFPTGYEHTAEEIHERRAAAHRRHRRNGRIRLLILVVVVALVVFGAVHELGGGPGKKTPPPKPGPHTPTTVEDGKGQLAKGSDSSLLPANLMIADWGSHKLLVISPTGERVWSYYQPSLIGRAFNPDFAFFNPSGSQIAITEESHSWLEVVGVSARKLLFTYGHYDGPGTIHNYLKTPSDALLYGDGEISVADIGNCRVAVIAPPNHVVVSQIGKTGTCTHAPPTELDSPQAAFPLSGGGSVVTELHDNWVDLVSASGRLVGALQVPHFKLAYSANETPSGDLIAVDHTHPGAVEIFTKTGKVVWYYHPTQGDGILKDPSLAEQLPNGDVIVSDDYHDRVIVLDYKTKKIVWQYGHTNVAGGSNGYLDVPVGFDFVHPDSLLDKVRGAAPVR
jgi:hypothetical protein